MLTIRRAQLLALGEFEGYVDRVETHLAERYPRRSAGDGEHGLRRHVVEAIEAGVDHGIQGEESLVTLAELLLEFGDRFERSPERAWACSVLEHRRLPGTLKVQLLAERLRVRTAGRAVVEFVVGA
ncbi:MAG: hypothetical protein AAF799_30820 [Myxococcota bacterium]